MTCMQLEAGERKEFIIKKKEKKSCLYSIYSQTEATPEQLKELFNYNHTLEDRLICRPI